MIQILKMSKSPICEMTPIMAVFFSTYKYVLETFFDFIWLLKQGKKWEIFAASSSEFVL